MESVFTNHEHHRHAFTHIFERICNENKIEHRKTKVKHPQTVGQVERSLFYKKFLPFLRNPDFLNRALKDLPIGPKTIESTVLSEAEEMEIIAF